MGHGIANTEAAAAAAENAASNAAADTAADTATLDNAADTATPEDAAETANSAPAVGGHAGSQLTDGDKAMYLGPVAYDFVVPKFVTVTSTSVALTGHRAYIAHDILIDGNGKIVEAVPRHRLRPTAKMPASVVSKVRPPTSLDDRRVCCQVVC